MDDLEQHGQLVFDSSCLQGLPLKVVQHVGHTAGVMIPVGDIPGCSVYIFRSVRAPDCCNGLTIKKFTADVISSLLILRLRRRNPNMLLAFFTAWAICLFQDIVDWS